MFNAVLLPVDLGHEASWSKALALADQLRGESGALHLLTVLPDFGETAVASFFPDDFREKGLQELNERLTAFIDEQGVAGATPHVAHGHVAESILDAAGEIGADLIVMASHPPDMLRSFLVGSETAKVVRHATIPVLAVR